MKVSDNRRHKHIIIYNELIDDDRLTATEKFVYICLCRFSNNEETSISQERLCKVTGLTRKTLAKKLRELQIRGFIEIKEQRRSNGQADVNHYVILDVPPESFGMQDNSNDAEMDKLTDLTLKPEIPSTARILSMCQNYTWLLRKVAKKHSAMCKNYPPLINNKHKEYKQVTLKKKPKSKDTVFQTGQKPPLSQNQNQNPRGRSLVKLPKVPAKPLAKNATHAEIAQHKITQAKESGDWSKVTARDYTLFYVDLHNAMMPNPITYDRYTSVSVMRDNVIKAYDVKPEQVCDLLESILRRYKCLPSHLPQLSFNALQKANVAVSRLIEHAMHELNPTKRIFGTSQEVKQGDDDDELLDIEY